MEFRLQAAPVPPITMEKYLQAQSHIASAVAAMPAAASIDEDIAQDMLRLRDKLAARIADIRAKTPAVKTTPPPKTKAK